MLKTLKYKIRSSEEILIINKLAIANLSSILNFGKILNVLVVLIGLTDVNNIDQGRVGQLPIISFSFCFNVLHSKIKIRYCQCIIIRFK